MMRTAISPRFAIRTFGFLAIGVSCGIRSTEGSVRAVGTGPRTGAGRRRPPSPRALGGGYRFDERDGVRARRWTVRPSGPWSAAGHQTAGRGRLGRTWEDVAGRALLCSIVLRPSAARPRTRAADPAGGRRLGGDRAGRSPTWTRPRSGRTTCWSARRRWAACWPRVAWSRDGCEVVISARASTSSRRRRRARRRARSRRRTRRPCSRGSSCGSGLATRSTPPRFSDEVRARWRAVAATLGRDVEAARTDGVPIRGRAVDDRRPRRPRARHPRRARGRGLRRGRASHLSVLPSPVGSRGTVRPWRSHGSS